MADNSKLRYPINSGNQGLRVIINNGDPKIDVKNFSGNQESQIINDVLEYCLDTTIVVNLVEKTLTIDDPNKDWNNYFLFKDYCIHHKYTTFRCDYDDTKQHNSRKTIYIKNIKNETSLLERYGLNDSDDKTYIKTEPCMFYIDAHEGLEKLIDKAIPPSQLNSDFVRMLTETYKKYMSIISSVSKELEFTYDVNKLDRDKLTTFMKHLGFDIDYEIDDIKKIREIIKDLHNFYQSQGDSISYKKMIEILIGKPVEFRRLYANGDYDEFTEDAGEGKFLSSRVMLVDNNFSGDEKKNIKKLHKALAPAEEIIEHIKVNLGSISMPVYTDIKGVTKEEIR